jgi:hypothetical protein
MQAYNRTLLIALILVVDVVTVFSQESNRLTGKVTNAETEGPVPNASIFITNSSRGTVSGTDGSFELKAIPAGRHDLIISSVGFATQVYSFSSDKLPLQLKIYLHPKATELEAVIVEPYEKDGWEKWGRFFVDNFVGTSDAARLCKIKNHQTLRFRFSKKNNTITAVADEPLIIENRELGYKITYQLENFQYNFGKQTLFYLGYTLFEDMARNKKKIPPRFIRERKKAYEGSMVHFIRSLYNNKCVEDGFEVRRLVKIPNAEKERVRNIFKASQRRSETASGMKVGTRAIFPPDSAEYYNRVMRQKDVEDVFSKHILVADSLVSLNVNGQRFLYFPDHLHVMYKKRYEEPAYLLNTMEARKPYHPRSEMFLQTGNAVVIESNGSCFPPTELFTSGYWAWSEKIAHLLPIDYEPNHN